MTIRSVPAVSRVLAPLGGLLIALGVFIPYTTFADDGGGTSVLDLDQFDVTFGFAIEPLAAACASIVSPMFTRVSPRLIAMLLAAVGAQTALMYVGYGLLAATSDGQDPGVGAFVGLAGALLVFTAGVVGLRAREPDSQPATSADDSLAPSGWYPDPTGEASERFWNGREWAEETR